MLAILKKVDAESLKPPQKFQVNIEIQLNMVVFLDYHSVSYDYDSTYLIKYQKVIETLKRHGPFLWMGFNCLKARDTLMRQFTFYHYLLSVKEYHSGMWN